MFTLIISLLLICQVVWLLKCFFFDASTEEVHMPIPMTLHSPMFQVVSASGTMLLESSLPSTAQSAWFTNPGATVWFNGVQLLGPSVGAGSSTCKPPTVVNPKSLGPCSQTTQYRARGLTS